MRAQNLTICVPGRSDRKDCDKKCPYCISDMTWVPEPNYPRMLRNTKKVLKMANTANVNSVLLTGKGEPFLSYDYLMSLARKFSEYPLEVQTNGIWLSTNGFKNQINYDLYNNGVDTIAVSMDRHSQFVSYQDMFKKLGRLFGLRITVNISDMIKGMKFQDLLNYCVEHGIGQLTLRKLTVPGGCDHLDAAGWIRQNAQDSLWDEYESDMWAAINDRGIFLRPLPINEVGEQPSIYDLDGVSVTYSEYCIQEKAKHQDEIRSLIFHQDGHLYTHWGSKASIIF